jgi:phospholipid/cholesterol/gamma-HCH transport system ATP-binding protein
MRVDAGEVHVDGERIDAWPERRLNELRRRVSYVVQGSALLDWMSLADNVCVPLARGLGIEPGVARARRGGAGEGGALGPRPPLAAGGRPGRAQAGLHRRALALAPRPSSTTSRPPAGPAAARGVDDVIRDLASQGTTALVVSHDLASIERIADRVAVLDEASSPSTGREGVLRPARRELPALKRFFRQGR